MTDFSNTPTVISVAFFFLQNGGQNAKILIAISIILCARNAFAEPKNGFDTNNKCYLETDGTDSAWFCDSQEKKCKQKMKKRHNIHWLYEGQSFTYGTVKAWC